MLLTIAEDFAVVATDSFAGHCQDAFQNDAIVTAQDDDVAVM
jgi:hypothetical protein